jgi:hypothetical protein
LQGLHASIKWVQDSKLGIRNTSRKLLVKNEYDSYY